MNDRPLDPNDLIALGLARTSGCSIEVARAEALPLLEFLEDNGARISYDLGLPKSAPRGDPATAAAEIADLSDRQWAVWWLLSFYGPSTDDELVDTYDALMSGADGLRARGRLLPRQTPQSIRSGRAELVRAGHVRATGERRPTSNGGSAQVWVATAEAGVRAA